MVLNCGTGVKSAICLIKNLDENGLLPQGKTYTN